MDATAAIHALNTIEALAAPVAEALGYELYDINYVIEYGQPVLRLFIDRPDSETGVSLNDCERFSRAVEPVLDQNDPIAEAYVLAVSSPGVERKLVKPAHFKRHVGAQVDVKTAKPYKVHNANQKKFCGTVGGFDDADDALILQYNDTELRLARQDIASCRLIYKGKTNDGTN